MNSLLNLDEDEEEEALEEIPDDKFDPQQLLNKFASQGSSNTTSSNEKRVFVASLRN